MAETKVKPAAKAPKLADPKEASIEVSTQEMIARAQKMGIDTVFDRAVTMKPCAIGLQGICCKNCAMGPCRLPLPKGGIEGEDTRKGLCGATANTIAARNFIRMIAGGAITLGVGVLMMGSGGGTSAITTAVDPETGDVHVYNTGHLYGEWPDGTPFDGNRYMDIFTVRGRKIVSTDVWNDSAEILLDRAGLAEAPL